jgi:hypothetical protein
MTEKSARKKQYDAQAKKLVKRLVEIANDHDPKREAEFQKAEAIRDEQVTKDLKEILAKRKK